MAFKLHISTPCSQNWDEMLAQNQENIRFCASCQKNVVDFTQMNDNEIMLFFQNQKEKNSVCGRMTEKQLAEIYPEPLQKPNFRWLRMVATVFTSVLSLNAWGQTQQSVQQTPNSELVFKAVEKNNLDTNEFVLRGKVIQKTARTPLENAQVVLQLNENETIGTYTDAFGNFQFRFSLEKYSLEKMQIAVMVSYETFLFSSNHFVGKSLMVCDVATKDAFISCNEHRIIRGTRPIIAGGMSYTKVQGVPFENMQQKPSHKYTMESQILNNSDVYPVK